VGPGTSSSSSHSGTPHSVFPTFFLPFFAACLGCFFWVAVSSGFFWPVVGCRIFPAHIFFGILFEDSFLCSANSKLWAMLSMHLGVLRSAVKPVKYCTCNCATVQMFKLFNLSRAFPAFPARATTSAAEASLAFSATAIALAIARRLCKCWISLFGWQIFLRLSNGVWWMSMSAL